MHARDSIGTFKTFKASRPPSKIFSINAPIPTILEPEASASRASPRIVCPLARKSSLRIFSAAGCVVDTWETTYLHVLEGDDPVLSWTRSTALRPITQSLDPEQASAFEAAYAARLRAAYPRRADGRTLFPFRRLFIVAQRS